MDVGWVEATGRRLARQGLTSKAASIEAAVTGMVGAHAQVLSAAELAIAARTDESLLSDVRAALLPGASLVKTYGPRGTVHLLPRDELPRWCAALAALPSGTTLPEADRLTPRQTEQVIEAIADILSEHDAIQSPPDAEQLGALIVSRTGSWAGDPVTPAFGSQWPRWRQAIAASAHAGVLAFGPSRGNRVTYLSPGVTVDPDADGSSRWLAREFVRSYGPTTSKQFARWLGTRAALTAALFERMGAELEAVRFQGVEAVVLADWTPEAAPVIEPQAARLLPHFDPYSIGSFPRERVYPTTVAGRALTNNQPGTRPVVLINGQVAGIWSARRTSARFDVTVEPFATLDRRSRSDLQRDAGRFGRFLGLEATLAEGTVTAGAHL